MMRKFYFKTDDFTVLSGRFKREHDDLAAALDDATDCMLDLVNEWISGGEGGTFTVEILADDLTPLAQISLSIISTTHDEN